jgi:hypothetical protein
MQSACALWPVWLQHIFPHCLINGTIFGKKLLRIKCVFWFSLPLLSETFLVLRRMQRDIIINIHRSSYKVPAILVRCWRNLNFLHRLSKDPQLSNFMKIRRRGRAALFHVDTQTWRSYSVAIFRNFANVPNNQHSYKERNQNIHTPSTFL